MNKELRYGTPPWGARLICTIYFSLGLLFITPFLFNLGPELLQWIMSIVGIGFMFASLKPSNWRGWLLFKVDDSGLYFPIVDKDAFFKVPWGKVGVIQIEKLYSQRIGITTELAISKNDVSDFLEKDNTVNQLLGLTSYRKEYFVVALPGNVLQSLPTVIKQLKRLRYFNSKME